MLKASYMDRPPLVVQATALITQAAPSVPQAPAPAASRPAAPEFYQVKRRAFEDSLKGPFTPVVVPGLKAVHQSLWVETVPYAYEKRHKHIVLAFQQYIRDFPSDYLEFLYNLGHP